MLINIQKIKKFGAHERRRRKSSGGQAGREEQEKGYLIKRKDKEDGENYNAGGQAVCEAE